MLCARSLGSGDLSAWRSDFLTLINTRSDLGGQSVFNLGAPLWKFTQSPFRMGRQCRSSTRVTAKIFHRPSTGQIHRPQLAASCSSATIPMHPGKPGIIGRSMICQIENGQLRKVHPAIQSPSSKPSTIFRNPVMGAPVRPTRTVYITIISGCLRFRSSNCPCTKNPTCDDVEREARKYTIAEANLVAVYER